VRHLFCDAIDEVPEQNGDFLAALVQRWKAQREPVQAMFPSSASQN
jgi:hypothetical protein